MNPKKHDIRYSFRQPLTRKVHIYQTTLLEPVYNWIVQLRGVFHKLGLIPNPMTYLWGTAANSFRRLTFASPMRDLYNRLSDVGFDKRFLQAVILPEWWEDSLATVPFNRAIAEASIAGHLGCRIADLTNHKTPLVLPSTGGELFKRQKNSDINKLRPTLQIARRAANIIKSAIVNVPDFGGKATAQEVRELVLGKSEVVNLKSLVQFCWDWGIPILRISRLPNRAGKFAGVAILDSDRPVIVMACGHEAPAWVAHYLAHEIGHIVLGHAPNEVDVIVDSELENAVAEDDLEKEADKFAFHLLTGKENGIKFAPAQAGEYYGRQLAVSAKRYAEKQNYPIDIGAVCLAYGFSTLDYKAAQVALRHLSLNTGSKKIINSQLIAHIDPIKLTESAARFVEAVCEIEVRGSDKTSTRIGF